MKPIDQYITVNGIKTRYWQQGDSGPTIILVHGFVASVEYWTYNIAELAKTHRVFALDLVGFGRTEKPNISYNGSTLAKFIKDFMDTLNVEKTTIIGHSLGGAVCLYFAILYSNMLEKLVLVDSGGLDKQLPFSFRLLTIPLLGNLLFKNNVPKNIYAKIVKHYTYNKEAITAEFIDSIYPVFIQPKVKTVSLKILQQQANLFGVHKKVLHYLLNNLKNITVPTLIIWGQEDNLLPISGAYTAMKYLPNAKLHIFDHCGHITQIEKNEEFNKLVMDFLILA